MEGVVRKWIFGDKEPDAKDPSTPPVAPVAPVAGKGTVDSETSSVSSLPVPGSPREWTGE